MEATITAAQKECYKSLRSDQLAYLLVKKYRDEIKQAEEKNNKDQKKKGEEAAGGKGEWNIPKISDLPDKHVLEHLNLAIDLHADTIVAETAAKDAHGEPYYRHVFSPKKTQTEVAISPTVETAEPAKGPELVVVPKV